MTEGANAGAASPALLLQSGTLPVARSLRLQPGAHAVLILDGADWHGSGELSVPENITTITLPPCSLELNPVENVWEYLRKNKLANRLYETYQDIVDACCDAWNALMAARGVLKAHDHPSAEETALYAYGVPVIIAPPGLSPVPVKEDYFMPVSSLGAVQSGKVMRPQTRFS